MSRFSSAVLLSAGPDGEASKYCPQPRGRRTHGVIGAGASEDHDQSDRAEDDEQKVDYIQQCQRVFLCESVSRSSTPLHNNSRDIFRYVAEAIPTFP